MSTATAVRRCAPEPTERSLFDEAMGGEPTLEELIAGVWEGLAVHGTSSCPVCGAPMEARFGAQQPHDTGAARSSEAGCRPRGKLEDGRCGSCGATLA